MASIKDVAKLAGVSVAAVSKYLKTPQNMREDTKEKISAAIEQLKFRPNPLAQSLRTGKTNIIAIALPEVDNPYFSQIFKLLQSLCGKQGLLAILLNNAAGEDATRIEGILTSGLVDGVIFYDDGQSDVPIRKLSSVLPVVIMTAQPDTGHTSTVSIDLQTGIQKLCSHLEETGARRLCYIGADNNLSAAQKIHALSSYCKNSTMQTDPVVYTTINSSYSDGFTTAKRLLAAEGALPDVIIAESDMIALGVLKGLTEGNVQVPDDVRLSGFDNTDISAMSNPSLTSVHIPMEEICNCAINMLCDLMNGKDVVPALFQTDLKIRKSTCPSD